MGFDYDVIIVGAGPGGSIAARGCAQGGLKTLLIEKERLPRNKPCGGGLTIKAARLLDFDLSPVIENTIYGAQFTFYMKDPFSIRSRTPIAFMVKRDRFDHFLVRKSLEAGAEVLEGTKATRVEERDSGAEVKLNSGEKLSCRYLIGADGPMGMVSKSLLPMRKDENRFALESEIPLGSFFDFPREDLCLLHFDFGRVPNGYGWIFPRGEGFSIGVGGAFGKGEKENPRHYFNTLIEELKYLPDKRVKNLSGLPLCTFYDEAQKISRGSILLVGDAASLVDPLTGEGIYQALRSGMLAAEGILEAEATGTAVSTSYQRRVKEVLFEDLKWALSVSRFIYRFTRLAYRTLKQYPELGEVYIQVMEGKKTYQDFVIRIKERAKELLRGRISEKIRRVLARS